MPCRVGITTDPERRKKEWKDKYPDLYGWSEYGPYPTKSEAQKKENELAQNYGCESHPGGAGKENDDWYVYMFYY